MQCQLRVGLVGCGKISQKYAECFRSNGLPAQIVAACDQNLERAAHFGRQFKVPTFTSISEMMDRVGADLDVCAVLTPSGFHAENVCELATLGATNIIVEKPISLTLDDAERAIDICDHNQCRLFVVNQWRYNRSVQALRREFERGRFGRISMLTSRLRWCRHQHYYDEAPWRGTWAHDGGVLTNQACHAIDLLLWFGGKVDSVFAMCETRLADIEAEDTAVAVIRFTSGALGALEATTAVRPKNLEASFSILGEGGAVELRGNSVDAIHTWRFERAEHQDETTAQIANGNPPGHSSFAHWAYLDEVFSCIREGREGGVDGRQAMNTLHVLHALYQSDRLGTAVEVNSHNYAHSPLGRRVPAAKASERRFRPIAETVVS